MSLSTDNQTLPSLPLWRKIDFLDVCNNTIPTQAEESIAIEGNAHPRCSQISAAPLPLYNTTSSPMVPRVGQQIPTKDEWQSHRVEITCLYQVEKKTLIEVMKIMRDRYDFRATTKMYKTRIADWDIRRNLRWSEREDACRVVKQRLLAGEKVSKVIVRGQEKSLAVFLRHMRSGKRGANHTKLLTQAETSQTNTEIANLSTFRSGLQDEAPLAPLYSAGDERRVEVICMQTAYICEASSNKPVIYCEDLFRNLSQAVKRAHEGRYHEARVMLNRAAEYFQWQARREADIVLLYFLSGLSLQSKGRLQHFDPLDLFHKHALAISDIVLGPCHPLTIILSQLLAVENWVVVASCAAQVAVDAIQLNPALSEFRRVTHCSREIFAEILEASGDYSRAGQLRLGVLRDYQVQVRECGDPVHEIKATSSLASHYLEFEPQRHEDAARLFQSILHIRVDPTATETRAYVTYKSFRGLAGCAEKSGNLGNAEYYHRVSAEAAVRCWGEGSSESVDALEHLARSLDLQGRYEEAKRVWSLCNISDVEDAFN